MADWFSLGGGDGPDESLRFAATALSGCVHKLQDFRRNRLEQGVGCRSIVAIGRRTQSVYQQRHARLAGPVGTCYGKRHLSGVGRKGTGKVLDGRYGPPHRKVALDGFRARITLDI